jgi:hypothetical protein
MNEGGRGPRAAAMLQYPARRHPRLSGGANGGSAIREADANRPPDSSIVAARTGPTGRGTGGKRATVATPGRPMAQGSKRSVGKRMESSVRSQAEGFRYGSHRVLESRGDARGDGQEAFAIAMPDSKRGRIPVVSTARNFRLDCTTLQRASPACRLRWSELLEWLANRYSAQSKRSAPVMPRPTRSRNGLIIWSG